MVGNKRSRQSNGAACAYLATSSNAILFCGGPTLYRIELLGQLRIIHEKEILTQFSTQKSASLLAYLAFYHDGPHLREYLSTLLWPDAEPQSGRNSLKQELTRLRRLMHQGAPEPTALIGADRQSVWIERSVVSIDTADFEECLRKAEKTVEAGPRSALLLEAIELYRGELAPGLYEEWVLRERERLAQRYVKVLHQAARDLAEVGDWDQALSLARKATELDPLSEESCEVLMRLCMARGRSGEALREYQKLEQQMKEEFHLAPGAVLQALAVACRTQSYSQNGSQSAPAAEADPIVLADLESISSVGAPPPSVPTQENPVLPQESPAVSPGYISSPSGSRRWQVVFFLSLILLLCLFLLRERLLPPLPFYDVQDLEMLSGRSAEYGDCH